MFSYTSTYSEYLFILEQKEIQTNKVSKFLYNRK
uniref:Uncharacterized protein n=1 Tax=Arundo donax TaxID=35708 RepID=A0A0A9EQB0_ARUDO